MNSEFFTLLLFFGGALGLLGFLYCCFGFFCIGTDFSGAMIVIRGFWARIFGLAYIVLGIPVFAYAYGATKAPQMEWYRWLAPQIRPDNYLYWLGGLIVVVITLHVISFFVKEME